MNCLFQLLVEWQTSWHLIDLFTEAEALKFHNQAIKDFTRRRFESTITHVPAVTIAVNRVMLNRQKVVQSSYVTYQPITVKIVVVGPLELPSDKSK